MRKKSIVFVMALALLISCTMLFAVSGIAKKKEKAVKGAELLDVTISMVNYSPAIMYVTPTGQGGGGPNLYIYSAEFSAFNPIAEEAVIGSVANPNRYGNERWTTKYHLTYYDENGAVELGDFTIQYITDAKGNARVHLDEDNLLSMVVVIDGKSYDLLTTVYAQNIMVMITPTRLQAGPWLDAPE